MRNTQKRQCILPLLAVVMSCLLILAWSDIGSGADTVKSVKEQVSKPRTIPLNQNSLRVTDPLDDKTKDAKVILQEQRYDVVLKKGTADTTSEWSGAMICYELRSTKTAVPYSHAIWSFSPLVGFRLFAHGTGENYLAWVEGTVVCFEDVSKSKGKEASLTEHVAKKHHRYLVPVADLAGREPFEGLNALHSDINIVSVGKDKAGFLRVKVQSPHTGKIFEFVYDGKVWKE
ncbi:MAG: hypothetical protein JW818_18255 [Pirellulales bacterium]|nr:hypothetical protein [Pirellulales bacterium]